MTYRLIVVLIAVGILAWEARQRYLAAKLENDWVDFLEVYNHPTIGVPHD